MMLGVHPFAALLVVVPAMAGFGYALQRGLLNRTLGSGHPSPASGHVRAFGHHSECLARDLYRRSPQAARRSRGNGQCIGRRNCGRCPAFADLRDCRRRDRRPAMDLLPNEPGREFRAVSDNQDIAQLMGLNKAHVFALAMALSLAVTAIAGILLGVRTSFRSRDWRRSPHLRIRSRHYRGPRKPLGHARRRCHSRGCPDAGREDQSGLAVTGWAYVAFLLVLAIRPNGLFPRVEH